MPAQTDKPDKSVAEQKRLGANIGWNYLSGLGSTASILLLLPWSLNVAGANAYGYWLLIFSGIQLLGLADFGLGTGVIRRLGELSRTPNSASAKGQFVALALFLFLGLAAVITASASAVGPRLLRHLTSAQAVPGGAKLLFIAAMVALFVTIVGRCSVSVLIAENRSDIERKWILGCILLRVAGLAAASSFPQPIAIIAVTEAIALSLPGVACTACVFTRFSLRHPGVRAGYRDAISLVRVSLVLFVGAFCALAANQFPLYSLSATMGLVAATGFAAVMRANQSLRMVVSWTTNPFMPHVSRYDTDSPELAGVFMRCFGLSFLVGVVLGAPVIVMSDQLVQLWLGVDYLFAATGLSLVALGLVASSIVLPANLFINLLGKPWHSAVLHVLWLLATVLLLSCSERIRESFDLSVLAMVGPLVLTVPVFVLLSYQSARPRLVHRWSALSLVVGITSTVFALCFLLLALSKIVALPIVAPIGYAIAIATTAAALFFRREWVTRKVTAIVN